MAEGQRLEDLNWVLVLNLDRNLPILGLGVMLMGSGQAENGRGPGVRNMEQQPTFMSAQVAQPEQKYLQLENILKCYHRPARITQFVTDGLVEHNNKMFSVFRFNLS